MTDGINGTDGVIPLFPHKPSAAPIPPQPDVIATLEQALSEAQSGRIVGIILAVFDENSNYKDALVGKVPMSSAITVLAKTQFGILAADYAKSMTGAK